MKRFEYDLTLHSQENFPKLVYFCNGAGQCQAEEVPANQLQALSGLLNEKGDQGWDLVQLSISDRGAVAVWKREVA